MSVKVEVTKSEEPKRHYPFIGESSNKLIVLFTSRGTGTVIRPNSYYGMGLHSSTWHMSEFIPFHGTVALSND